MPSTPVSPPSFFSDQAVRNDDLSAFAKVTDAFARAKRQSWTHVHMVPGHGWNDVAKPEQIDEVNRLVNDENYITDFSNYGEVDYWTTPLELHEHGGDCEDFALAKYLALASLGFDIKALRIAVVRMVSTGGAHAVLVVRNGDDVLVLDNRIPDVVGQEDVPNSRPIYSIKENAWWFYPASARVRTWS